MRQRGQTLYELMISLVMIGVIAALCASIVGFARREDRMTRGYADDLRHLRTASDLLSSEIRGARCVEVAEDGDGVVIDGARWYVANDALLRDSEVAVRGVSKLRAEPRGATAWHIAVAPVPRREGARAPMLSSTVRVRAGGTR